jgi:hypothetical protein
MTRASDTAKLLGAGATILDGTTISTADNDPQLVLTSTDADGDRGPVVQFTRDSGSPADNDVLGRVQFLFDNDAAEVTTAVQLEATATDVSNGTEDSALNLVTMVDGNTRGRLKFTSSEAVFNEDSIDLDFRVESDGNTHGIFLDAGAGLVGIGNSNPDGHYNLADDLVIGNGSGGRGLTIYSGNDSSGYIGFNDAEQDSMTAYIQYGHNDNNMTLATSAGASLKIDSTGAVTKPLQPAFMARPSSSQTSIASDATIAFGTEVFDQNADYNNSNYIFTAPITGRYQLDVTVRAGTLDTAATYIRLFLTTSNRNYETIFDLGGLSGDPAFWTFNINVLADMDASDTAFVKWSQSGGASQSTIGTVEASF